MEQRTNTQTTIILVPGHWLGGWAWDAVAAPLRSAGHRVVTVTLPGFDPQDPDRRAKTLVDQARFLESEVSRAAEHGDDVVLVAHSGAGFPVSALIDAQPRSIGRVIYVDSGPVGDGSAIDELFPAEAKEAGLPAFDQLEASVEGLDPDALELFRERAVPVPGPVMRERVVLGNDARHDVPTTIIACSYPADALMQMARDGVPMMAEVARLRHLRLIDLPTGHWPMWSRPEDLAAAIASEATLD